MINLTSTISNEGKVPSNSGVSTNAASSSTEERTRAIYTAFLKRSHLFTEFFKLLTVKGEPNETQTMGQ